MVYKLYLETAMQNGEIAWSYAFYNHQDFMVYKRFGKSETTDINKTILTVSAIALKYFEGSIRRRYYDEHFSTRIDEDYVTLYSHYPEIETVAKRCKTEGSVDFVTESKELWEDLVPFFKQRTMDFESSTDIKFIEQGTALALKAFENK